MEEDKAVRSNGQHGAEPVDVDGWPPPSQFGKSERKDLDRVDESPRLTAPRLEHIPPPLEPDYEQATFAGGRSMIMSALIILTGIICYYHLPFLMYSHASTQDFYSVVFDAGSTGSRVFIFQFKVKADNKHDALCVRLEKEVFRSVEPGISAYARNPQDAARSLKPLLLKAIVSVPENQQLDTLVSFKATAGLRLLPSRKAERILHHVQELLLSSPFNLPDPKQVMIMSGEEEGLFGWVTVNFLLDSIWSGTEMETVTTIDLGGGSIQVSFEISSSDILREFLVKDLYSLDLLHSKFHVFTHSNLGYGLKSARLGIMGCMEGPNGVISHDPAFSTKLGPDGSHIELFSPCYALDRNFTFTHADVSYEVIGTSREADVFPECQLLVEHFVEKGNFMQHEELSHREIHLFSYFFDIGRWAKLIPWNDHHEILTPESYLNASMIHCVPGNFSMKHPFLCMDLLYVHAVLTVGVGLPQDKNLNVESQLLGREVSWTLGAALSTLTEEFSYTPLAEK